jgi:transcriptional regulator with XRE-family HTH domain
MIGPLLKEWRTVRGKSQLDLALDAEVSARHLSFLESGRARPSAEMVLRLAEALGLPLRERNAMLVASGYAPQFGESAWDSEAMAEVRRAAGIILKGHAPYPAVVLDAAYVMLDANDGALAMLGETRAALGQANLMDYVFAPGPVRAAIDNWDEVAGYLIHRLRENVRLRGPRSAAAVVLQRAMEQPGAAALAARSGDRSRVLLPLVFTSEGETTQWYTTVTSFGAAQDALAEEVTIELFHPQ